MTATIIPMPTVDLVREYQSLPPKSRGRKVLERIIARQKRERLEAEVAARQAEIRRSALIAAMVSDLEAAIEADFSRNATITKYDEYRSRDFALSPSGKEG